MRYICIIWKLGRSRRYSGVLHEEEPDHIRRRLPCVMIVDLIYLINIWKDYLFEASMRPIFFVYFALSHTVLAI
jgi:hypothetical protein